MSKNLSGTGLSTTKFADIWARTGMPGAVEPTRAYSFSRAGAGARLDLSLAPVKPVVRLDADWRVAPAGAELRLQATWQNAADRSLLALALPPGLQALSVEGTNVHHWHVQDGQLHVWMEKPSSKGVFTVAGVLPGPLKEGKFSLPNFGAPQAKLESTTVSLRPGLGWLMAPQRLLHLTSLGDGPDLRYQAQQPAYEGL